MLKRKKMEKNLKDEKKNSRIIDEKKEREK
jgi:hypothetical protein